MAKELAHDIFSWLFNTSIDVLKVSKSGVAIPTRIRKGDVTRDTFDPDPDYNYYYKLPSGNGKYLVLDVDIFNNSPYPIPDADYWCNRVYSRLLWAGFPRPTAIVFTGNGFHFYWRFLQDEWIDRVDLRHAINYLKSQPNPDKDKISWMESHIYSVSRIYKLDRLNKVIKSLSDDKIKFDFIRSISPYQTTYRMRLPLTFNTKFLTPFCTMIIHYEPDNRYNFNDLERSVRANTLLHDWIATEQQSINDTVTTLNPKKTKPSHPKSHHRPASSDLLTTGAIKWIREHVIQVGYRHKAMFAYAVAMYHRGYPQYKTLQILKEWKKYHTSSPYTFPDKEIEKTVKSVYKHNYGLNPYILNSIYDTYGNNIPLSFAFTTVNKLPKDLAYTPFIKSLNYILELIISKKAPHSLTIKSLQDILKVKGTPQVIQRMLINLGLAKRKSHTKGNKTILHINKKKVMKAISLIKVSVYKVINVKKVGKVFLLRVIGNLLKILQTIGVDIEYGSEYGESKYGIDGIRSEIGGYG